jgi:hypothetical protein
MTDETTREPEWITIVESSRLLGRSANKHHHRMRHALHRITLAPSEFQDGH